MTIFIRILLKKEISFRLKARGKKNTDIRVFGQQTANQNCIALEKIKFVMSTLVSRDCLPFYQNIKRHVYPGNQGTHDKLYQIKN